MFTRGLALCLVLAFATVAQAGAVIDLVPDMAGPTYMGGETITVDFRLSVDPPDQDPLVAGGIYARQLQFDMTQSDSALTLNSFAFNFADAQAICALVPPMCGNGHERFPQLDNADGEVVTATYTASSQDAMTQLIIPVDGTSVSVGTLELVLPAATSQVEIYTLDAITALNGDPTNYGAQLLYGFGGADGIPSQSRYPMSGGMLAFEVVPEPATLALLALGGLAALRRRRA